MTQHGNDLNPRLLQLVEAWLKRSLTPHEREHLSNFVRHLVGDKEVHDADADDILARLREAAEQARHKHARVAPAHGEAATVAAGSVYQKLTHSTGILFQNAVNDQQQQNILSQAAANQGILQIYHIDTTTTPDASEKLTLAGVSDHVTNLLVVLNAFHH